MRLGFVSTRFAGTDGVTLEAAKLAAVAREAGHEIFWFAGELGPEQSRGTLCPAAHFATEENQALERACFGRWVRDEETTATIRRRADDIKQALKGFVATFGVEVLVPQNALCIPMQLPLGVAITETIHETGIAAVAHHHDFSWERERFARCAVPDILAGAFPPVAPSLRHMVIHSGAREELARRRGIAATVLPNVMDFERGPAVDGNGARYRRHAGLSDDDVVILQPTRVVPRKGIETTLELARELSDAEVKVVVCHAEGDEGKRYGRHLRALAQRLEVDLRFRPVPASGEVTLADAYAAADLVAYPSRVEGFGNALLEAFFYRRPVFVNRYPVYATDIAPTGVRCIEIEGSLVTKASVREVGRWLESPETWREAAEANYDIGRRCFSFDVVRRRFLPLLTSAAAC